MAQKTFTIADWGAQDPEMSTPFLRIFTFRYCNQRLLRLVTCVSLTLDCRPKEQSHHLPHTSFSLFVAATHTQLPSLETGPILAPPSVHPSVIIASSS